MREKYEWGQKTNNRLRLNRRDFLRAGATSITGLALSSFLRPPEILAQASVTPRNTAKSCIFVALLGAPSHVDTFDAKQGAWTPSDFNIQTVNNITMPVGLFPTLAQQSQHLAVVRTLQSWNAQHNIAQYWLYTGQDFNPAFLSERPGVGAVVAMEYQQQRQSGDVLPGFVALNGTPIGNGFLSALFAPFVVAPSPNGISGLSHPEGQARFATRWDALQSMDAELRSSNPSLGKPVKDYNDFYQASRGMMYNQVITDTFRYTAMESQAYGNTSFGNACLLARNVMMAKKGTHFVFIPLGGWDEHVNIYSRTNGIYGPAGQLDKGLGTLIADLAAAPGSDPSKSLLDETLIVAMGEFGRTPPNLYSGPSGLNAQSGRDHYPNVQFALFAGGGVRGGRAIGTTNATGSDVVDYGWTGGRPVRMEDVASTIYSALGINWTKEIRDTPSHRVYQYIPGGPQTVYRDIPELFG
jgi:hypothetical protein